ncbi:MAG: hypothetical protein EA422_06165, partial [Gemmatimonadales bacterium]
MSRINTNVAAMNAQRNIGLTDVSFQRTVGRLSSGFRINRAADDAAGLGIANQFRADIRALEQASANASQANSLLQVAEGATNQVAGIVDRMKELASQAASDNVNEAGRALIQAEYSQLQQEITRIVDTTNFQGVQLLAGTGFDVGANESLSGADGESGFLGTLNAVANLEATVSGAPTAAGEFTLTAAFTAGADADGGDPATAGVLTISVDGVEVANISTTAEGASAGFSAADPDASFEVNGLTFNLDFEGAVTGSDLAGAINDTTLEFSDAEAQNSLQFMVSVSGNATAETGLAADFVQLSFLDLNLETLGLDADASEFGRAEWAGLIDNIDSAITTINTAFGTIGAA